MPEIPCLSLAIDRLRAVGAAHFAIHVIKAPYPGGYAAMHDCIWPDHLSQTWRAWQEMFSSRGLPDVPHIAAAAPPASSSNAAVSEASPLPVGGRLMQHLGVSLWQWLFDGPIQNSFNQSQGIAIGQTKPLRLRLDIRDPELIALPWEIMQAQVGRQAIALSEQVLFSRTTSDVDHLPPLRTDQSLNVLLVLGQDAPPPPGTDSLPAGTLHLEQEATALARILQNGSRSAGMNSYGTLPAPCQVDTLIQPSSAELIDRLETGAYNVLFYAGHGAPAPDGGLLFLNEGKTLNGTELAQVLTRCRVKLAVFNACWGAQPEQQGQQFIARSSLAEVLLHHGVPAVLAMRDSITDQEALSFIQTLSYALRERLPIDQAVAVARQHLLTLYRFNQPAWTLPVLYMHPEFDGELIRPLEAVLTELPGSLPTSNQQIPKAALRSLEDAKLWSIRGGLMRIGSQEDNDVVMQNGGISRRHAEIFYRNFLPGETTKPAYFLRDFSRYGTWVSGQSGWQQIHHQEVPLQSGIQLRFGSPYNPAMEFLITDSTAPGEAKP